MKKFFLLCFSFFLCLPLVHGEEVVLQSPYAILYNLDEDSILFENASEEEIPIASLTKIMTTLVAIEHIPSLEDTVVLTPNVFYGLREANASVAEFKIGQKVTYLDLLYGAMLPSGADATRALAISLAGSEEDFVTWMNLKAEELGLIHTHYVNTSGLDILNHYSTVKDVATVLKYALQNDTFKTIFTTKEYTTSDGTLHFKSTLLKMQEKYHIDISHIQGAKTGFTNKAGSCLASIASNHNVNYLLVTAGIDHTIKQPLHILDAMNTYQYYFEHYEYYPIIKEGDVLTTLQIGNKKTSTLPVTAQQSIYEFLKKDELDLHTYYIGQRIVDTDVLEGQKIGEFVILNQGKILKTIDVNMPITLEKTWSEPVLLLLGIVFFVVLLVGGKIYVQNRNH